MGRWFWFVVLGTALLFLLASCELLTGATLTENDRTWLVTAMTDALGSGDLSEEAVRRITAALTRGQMDPMTLVLLSVFGGGALGSGGGSLLTRMLRGQPTQKVGLPAAKVRPSTAG